MNETKSYADFLRNKSQFGTDSGFEPVWMPEFLYPFQTFLTNWSIRKGRAGLLEGCGLGKTPQQLVVAENIVRHTNRPALVITPLAVASQTVREAEKFGIEAKVSRDGTIHQNITVTNYEKLHLFDESKFGGFVLDEGQVLKGFDGKRRKTITRFISKSSYRFIYSATPSPNDHIELGTWSEALGVMTQSDMLGYFFVESDKMRHTTLKEDDFWNKLKWHFKPHAEKPFWRWVASWARACACPEDLGFDGSAFKLPPLKYHSHVIDCPWIPDGELFPRPAISLHEARIERHRTLDQRCEKVAEIVASHKRPMIVWCHWNEEGDLLEKLIPDCVQVAGKDSDDAKEERLTAFALNKVRVLVTKPKIGALGLNLQHCGDMTFFPTFSYEQFHQGVRRCWRFGRKGPVNVHIVSAEGEAGTLARLEVKQKKHEHSFREVVRNMRDENSIETNDRHTKAIVVPAWLNGGFSTNGHH